MIPNEAVREQIYAYLLSTYKENNLTYDDYEKRELDNQVGYADSEVVRTEVKSTQLHKLVVIFRSVDMVVVRGDIRK